MNMLTTVVAANPSVEKPSERALRVAKGLALYDAIRVPYARQAALVEALDEVRLAGAFNTTGHHDGLLLIAPFGTGKTVALEQLVAHANRNDEPGQRTVLLTEMDTDGTTGSVPTSILRSLGVRRPDIGRETVRWDRAIDELKEARTQLVIFDEINRASRREMASGPIATAIRERLMDAGVAPVAFVGSADAEVVFKKVPELVQRLVAPVSLDPLDYFDKDGNDRKLFEKFVGDLDRAIVAAGIVPCPAGLQEPALAKPLAEATAGNLRAIVKVVREALKSVLRRHGERIERQDLEFAVEDWAMRNSMINYNPFAS